MAEACGEGEGCCLSAAYRRSDADAAVGVAVALAGACMWTGGCGVAHCGSLVKSVIGRGEFHGSREKSFKLKSSYEHGRKCIAQVTNGDVDISLFVVLLVLRWVAPYLHGENYLRCFADPDGWRFRCLAGHRHHPHPPGHLR